MARTSRFAASALAALCALTLAACDDTDDAQGRTDTTDTTDAAVDGDTSDVMRGDADAADVLSPDALDGSDDAGQDPDVEIPHDSTTTCPPGFWGPGCDQVCACDDGLYCNGLETCDPLVGCQSGVSPVTDDGLSCTVDTCDDTLDAVIHTPDDSACDDGNACTAGRCTAAGCEHVNLPDGDACDSCTTGFCGCEAGTCVAQRRPPRRSAIGAASNAVFMTLTNGQTFAAGERSFDAVTPVPPSNEGGYVAVTGGDAFACALEPTGALVCWPQGAGITPWAGLDSTPSESGYRDLVSANRHACALATDGQVVCWGENDAGETDAPIASDEGGFVRALAGSQTSCGVEPSGALKCIGGRADAWSALASTEGGFVEFATGYDHVCGLEPSGTIVCQGAETAFPDAIPSAEGGYTDLFANNDYTCGLEPSGAAVCWGGRFATDAPPRSAEGGFDTLLAGRDFLCGLEPSGRLLCAGDEPSYAFGAFGPLPPNTVDIGLNNVGACALTTDGDIHCNGSVTSLIAAVPTSSEGGFAALVAGRSFCALEPSGTPVCFAGVSDGAAVFDETLSTEGGYVQVAAGFLFARGREPSGALVCWGTSRQGNISPPPSTQGGYADLWLGGSSGCAMEPDGTVVCWGQHNPPEGGVPDSIRALGIGQSHTCVINERFETTCWGSPSTGATTPVPSTEGGYDTLTAGGNVTCATEPSRTVVCWGAENFGQLDVLQSLEGGYETLLVGSISVCGIEPSGAPRCWGGVGGGFFPAPIGLAE